MVVEGITPLISLKLFLRWNCGLLQFALYSQLGLIHGKFTVKGILNLVDNFLNRQTKSRHQRRQNTTMKCKNRSTEFT